MARSVGTTDPLYCDRPDRYYAWLPYRQGRVSAPPCPAVASSTSPRTQRDMVARRRLRTTPRHRLSQRQRLGRPDEYRPEYCEMLMRSGAQGYSLTAFGGSIGVARDTLNQWAKKYPAFAAAKNIAEALACYYWENLLKRLAEQKLGNATAIIFALKNRVPEEWRERVVTEHTGADAGPVRLELDASQLRDLPVDQVRVLEDILQQISSGTGAQLMKSAAPARTAAESDDEAAPASYEDTLH